MELDGIMKQLKAGLKLLDDRFGYLKNSSCEKLCEDMRKEGFDFSIEQVKAQYETCYNVEALYEYYYNKDKALWDVVDQKQILLHSDIFDHMIRKIITENYDMMTVGDLSYIEGFILDMDPRMKEEDYQKQVELYLQMLIAYSKKNNVHSLDGLFKRVRIEMCLEKDMTLCLNHHDQFMKIIDEFNNCYGTNLMKE